MLILVVGPSGAGKDTLIEGARQALSQDPGFVFPPREITRPAMAGGEAHIEVSEAEFTARAGRDGYILHWRAHGLGYGISASARRDLDVGRRVVVNVSRSVIEEARRSFATLRVIQVTAPETLLRDRLQSRGRETREDQMTRVARSAMAVGAAITIVNDGTVEAGVEQMLTALQRP